MLAPSMQIYKGRLVAQGNAVKGVNNRMIFEKSDHEAPLNTEEAKALCTYALKEEDPAMAQGDVLTAYPKVRLGGRKILARNSRVVFIWLSDLEVFERSLRETIVTIQLKLSSRAGR